MLRFAILGAGKIARTMSKTVRMMMDNGEDIELYAVAARDPARAQAFADEFGIKKAFGSYEEMLSDPDVGLVYVATPHSHHAQHMKMCIAHHKPILCEKAFTRTFDEAKEVLDLAEKERVFVAEAIWTRYMPSRKMITDLIASGEIGIPTTLTANLGYPIANVDRIRLPELAGGAMLDLGVYPITFASNTFGDDIADIQATSVLMDTGVDLQDNITIRYQDGRMACLLATAACLTDRRGMVYGTKGMLEVENINDPQSITVISSENRQMNAVRKISVPPRLTGYEYEVRACMRALSQGKLECEEMPHAEILRIMSWLDQVSPYGNSAKKG